MSLRHHEDLLSLEELARSLAALEEGSDAVVDAAARASILRAQLSRALNEQRGEVLELASTAALARRPSDAEVGERLDGFGGGLDSATAQLLGALLRGDGRAAAAAAAAAAASREGGQRAGDRDGWAQREHRVRAGDIDFWARTGQTGAPPSLPEGGSVREHVPTPKRKHESSDSPVLVGRARTTQLALGQELQADNALWPTTRMIAGKATPAAEHFEYDADDDSESEWVGHDAFDSPWPTRAGAAMEMG
eukprot:CAMPEP_0179839400 /NCGR_PEP_ID=MMETSP0982-20121206/1300_1 /TAXON_ID=483367 /ORGANISM="non described non described, Strain CCMP 2436" /LENGTH=249 /DNA_ID=CAMNT_0021723057 /DNA_START=46 /DNA_END=795 /DNA_ORIENTATION=-